MMRGEQCRRIIKSDQEYSDSLGRSKGEDDICLRKAQVAGMKRLLACLVNEGYLEATMTDGSDDSVLGKFLVLKMNGKEYDQAYLFCRYYMKLVEQPFVTQRGTVIYLDPDECGPTLLREDSDGKFQEIRNPVDVMRAVCQFHQVSDVTTRTICDQIADSVMYQQYLYLHPPKEPSLFSSIIEWEQSLVEGHATHPMNRTRLAEPPMPPVLPSTNLMDTTVNFLAVKRNYLTILGPFEDITRSYLSRLKISLNDVRLPDSGEFVIFPVHCLQLPNIFLYHREHVRLLPFTASAQAQSALRTLNLPDFPEFCLKTSLALEITSRLRNMRREDCEVGRNMMPLLDKIVYDRERLIVANEVASAYCNNLDIKTARYMATIFRESSESLIEGRDENAILSCALTELNDRGLARVCDVFQLDTVEKKVAWFTSYAQTFLEVFLPMVVQNGLAFEAHAQNTLLRVDKENKSIKGFIIRDFAATFVHLESLRKTTGNMSGPIGRTVVTLKMVNFLAYHTIIRCHLNRFVRALGLHYKGGLGWKIVRDILIKLSGQLPKDAINYGVFDEWLRNPKSHLKSFIKIKLEKIHPLSLRVYPEIESNLLYLNDE